MKGFIKEFKEFALKGNVVDLAIAVVIGGAFGAIVKSLVNDIIMPLIGIIIGGHSLKGLNLTVGTATIMFGSFLQTIINFLIIALSIFFMIKVMNGAKNKFKKEKEEVKEVKVDKTEVLLTEIRDLLKK